MFLLDSGVWVAAGMLENEHHGAAKALLRQDQYLAGLDLTLYEVTNVIARRYRQPDEARRVVRAIVQTCAHRLVRVDPDLLDAATEVVAEHGLSGYDATYVAAARRNNWQLVSLDIRDLVSKGLAVTPDAAVYP
jgi:predicted nucleic acid-binding protein